MPDKIVKSDEEWRKELTPEQYKIMREKGTEAPGTGEYYHSKEKGMYLCAACGQELFSSDAKYDSGSGWPSFWAPAGADKVETAEDGTLGMRRVEIMCSRCGAHLGHVFDDGPAETTGKRFCVNSASLKLKKE
ncbi:MAG TPA: peptide-methionine (R)-S-oxide reductase MsrB [Candidatus Eisenbacteria bacterium]|jgi:peptide-methionine (R)-S-oxide reductase|nr:peptide-methionine (R)-S-oxide reductase MsrB [Candidatus Eisenbacteria bacterium]